MAIIYVRSTDGSNADNGSTWALAKADLTGAAAIDAAGDTIYVSQAHAESTASSVTLAFAGTVASYVKVIGVNDSAEPPTAMSTANSVTVTGNNSISISGSVYVDSINFTSGALISFAVSSSAFQHFKSCKFKTTNTGSSGNMTMPTNNVISRIIFDECTFYFSGAANKITLQHSVWLRGGGLESGTTSPTTLFTFGGDGRGGEVVVENFDLSNGGASMNLVNGSSLGSGLITFRNCKLPASWTGSLISSGITSQGLRARMLNCDSTDTNYRIWVEDYSGSVKSETTIVKTGGASDGTTGLSWKIVSTANASFPGQVFRTEEICRWNDTTGSSITVTVDILRDSATNLKDDEIWLEVRSFNTSGYPLGSTSSDAKADFLATAADQTSSSATWTTTGMSNPNKQKLSVSFTPQEKGYIQARVCVAKASTTVYIDPVLQVS